MPDNLKSGIENLSGYSMDDVKVHYNSSQPAQLNALAYAQGTDIHIASGQEKHLAHEAWHVVQQKQGRVKPTMQMKQGIPVNDDKGLEKEADDMGAKAMQMKKEEGKINAATNITHPVVQRLLKPGDKVSLDSTFGKPVPGKAHLEGLGAEEAWRQINAWVISKARAKGPPTIEEVVAYYGSVTVTKPAPKVETSDVKEEYDVKKGCALQALINFKGTVLGKSTAEELHDHIWATEDLAAYKEYDINWPALYTNQGITMDTDNEGKKVNALTEKGTYIIEIHGHMMVAVKPARGAVTLQQDGSNAIGKLTDVIKKSFKKA